MRQNPRLFRLTATVAIGALLCNAVPPAAWAQSAPPPPAAPDPNPAGQNQADPPTRVGRIASQSGAVSFRTSADTQWSPARTNFPVSSGDSFWTEPTARAELQIAASSVALSGQTEFDITNLADSGLQAVAPQGELYLHLVNLAPDEVWSIDTPRGTVRLTKAGRYGIVVGTTDQPTQITVLDGAAEVEGPGVSLKVAANQTATVTGSGPYEGSVGAITRDAFLASRLAAERPPVQSTASIPAQVAYIPGADDLSGYGQWSQAPDYGDVWYPPVQSDWVPYRDGDWAYVAPWGWTWVDRAPWGFTPSHYGRWAHIGGRWGWVPGEASRGERSVYAPALVTFLGLSAGVALGAAAMRHGSVAWVPLGPKEAYHPWYHASPNYVRQINAGHVRDPAALNRPMEANSFANRAGATSVPASVMMGSRPVRASARSVPEAAFASAHPVIGQQPIGPSATTLGVTPAVARQLNLGASAGVPRHAPGPVVQAQQPGPATGTAPRPALVGPHGERPNAVSRPDASVRPGEPAVSGPGAVHVPGGPPALPTPGTRPAGLLPGSTEAHPTGAPPAPGTPPGLHPEAGPHPGISPDVIHPGGPPTPGPHPGGGFETRPGQPGGAVPNGAHPEGLVRPGPGQENTHPPGGARPELPGAAGTHSEGIGRPGPAQENAHPPAIERPAIVPHPAERAPEIHAPPPPHVTPPQPPHVEQARPPAPPHIEQTRPPPPHVEQPRPPPHIEQARPAPPPPPRPAPPPPPPAQHAAPPPPPAPHPAPPPPPPQKKPGER